MFIGVSFSSCHTLIIIIVRSPENIRKKKEMGSYSGMADRAVGFLQKSKISLFNRGVFVVKLTIKND